MQPTAEPSSITGVRIKPPPLLHRVDKNIRRDMHALKSIHPIAKCYIFTLHNRVSDGNGHYGVVRKKAIFAEQREVFCLYVVPLVDRACNVTNDCAKHFYPHAFTVCLHPRTLKISINTSERMSRGGAFLCSVFLFSTCPYSHALPNASCQGLFIQVKEMFKNPCISTDEYV